MKKTCNVSLREKKKLIFDVQYAYFFSNFKSKRENKNKFRYPTQETEFSKKFPVFNGNDNKITNANNQIIL